MPDKKMQTADKPAYSFKQAYSLASGQHLRVVSVSRAEGMKTRKASQALPNTWTQIIGKWGGLGQQERSAAALLG